MASSISSASTAARLQAHYPDLAGRVVLVTGASSGIGAATARLLGRQGARVVLAARRTIGDDATTAALIRHGLKELSR